jgi:hypothetical protein
MFYNAHETLLGMAHVMRGGGECTHHHEETKRCTN